MKVVYTCSASFYIASFLGPILGTRLTSILRYHECMQHVHDPLARTHSAAYALGICFGHMLWAYALGIIGRFKFVMLA